jgi:subtilisin family serine protease
MEMAKYNDRVDIINMSLGAPYGQPFDDDLSAAVDNATRLGILTVASAGNSGDKPYATGTPSAAAIRPFRGPDLRPQRFLP